MNDNKPLDKEIMEIVHALAKIDCENGNNDHLLEMHEYGKIASQAKTAKTTTEPRMRLPWLPVAAPILLTSLGVLLLLPFRPLAIPAALGLAAVLYVLAWLIFHTPWRKVLQRLALAGKALATLVVFIAFIAFTLLSELRLAAPVYLLAGWGVCLLYLKVDARSRADLVKEVFSFNALVNVIGFVMILAGNTQHGQTAMLLILGGYAVMFYTVARLMVHLLCALIAPSAKLATVEN